VRALYSFDGQDLPVELEKFMITWSELKMIGSSRLSYCHC
jgi:hypothetical protein